MDPLTGAALIGVGSQLLGGLLGASAQAKQQRTQAMQQAAATQFQMEGQARQLAEQQQQSALGNLVDAYRSALTGGGR